MTDKITEGRAKAITDSLEAAGVKPSKCSQEPMCPALHSALHSIADDLALTKAEVKLCKQRIRSLEHTRSARQLRELKAKG